jgi:hypothetical protein
MNSRDVAHHRLINQQLIECEFNRPHELVRWMGCIQAQDYAGAKWAIGCRIKGIRDEEIENDFNKGKILRTHVLRPTWHFISPEDIHWMLKLTAPRVKAFCKSLHKKLDIDDKALRKSKAIITKALAGGRHLDRDEIKNLLKTGKLNTDDIRLGFYLMDAELNGLICSGERKGKQFTYALLEERVRKYKTLDHDEAIAELAKRYFRSHGPATLHDFAWWSGLTLTDGKKGIELNHKNLSHLVLNGQAYWFSEDATGNKAKTSVYLLPPFDEFTVAYKDRMDIVNPKFYLKTGNGMKPVVVQSGQITGIWKRTELKDKVEIEITSLEANNKTAAQKIKRTSNDYAKFLNKDLGKLKLR